MVALPRRILVVSFLLLAGFIVASPGQPALSHPGVVGPASSVPDRPLASPSWGAPARSHGTAPEAAAMPSRSILPSGNGTNLSWCDPLPPFLDVPNLGVNFSVAISPGNGSGAGPLNLSWNITVGGGGLPPYEARVWVWQPIWQYFASNYTAFNFNSSQFQGNVTLTTPGAYWAYFEVGDSSCTQVSGDWVPVHVWNALGAHPLVLSANSTGGTAPLAVTYSANSSNIPANWSVLWTTQALYSNNTTFVEHEYYLPGTYEANACLVEPDGQFYTCAVSPNVTVSGPSPVNVASVVTPGPMPEQVTFWANASGTPALPNGTLMWLTASNGTNDTFNSSTNGSVSLRESVACGPPFTFVPPTGTCTWIAVLDLIGPPGSANSGALGNLVIPVVVRANGSFVSWYPTVSTSYGPTNGSAPLNVSLNVTATNGVGPYALSWTALGRASVLLNGSFYLPLNGSRTGWNGSTLSVVLPLNLTGVYFVTLVVNDANGNTLPFALPLVTVGYVLAPAPLNVFAAETALATNATVGTSVSFEISVTGGLGPYQVQWAFGDGSYASSAPTSTVVHAYATSGTYHPTIRVVDGRGDAFVSVLPAIEVLFSVAPHVTPHSTPVTPPSPAKTPSGPGTVNWAQFAMTAAVSAGLAGVGALLVRWEWRREGDELVAGLGTDPRSAGADH